MFKLSHVKVYKEAVTIDDRNIAIIWFNTPL